jgi:lipopolysaccharide/colanic/teichoic acid biosynthesis glycosyltransferase
MLRVRWPVSLRSRGQPLIKIPELRKTRQSQAEIAREIARISNKEQAVSLSHEDVVSNLADPIAGPALIGERTALDEELFLKMIAIERKRTERSKSPFVLMLLEVANQQNSEKTRKALECILKALLIACRDTDLVGWYKNRKVVGTMFTGLVVSDKNSILSAILTRVSSTLRDELTFEQFSQISITFHLFPDDWENDKPGRPSNSALYPDLETHDTSRKGLLVVKRSIDVAICSVLLMLLAPVMLAVALAVRLSSKGPILFRQQRVGQFGQNFTFLKFRSMYVNNDHSVHKEFVTKLIAEEGKSNEPREGKNVYKLTNDKRITKVGGFLRRSSLDELPQLLNVLRGDMSLVGPRPPIPYELAAYQTWHRRRVLEVKPGITGLWQVTGRSRVKFDEMVRLDLRYATSWTPWLDLKILLMTPMAVIRGSGAF